MGLRRSGASTAGWGLAVLVTAVLAGACGGGTTTSDQGGTPTTAPAPGASGQTIKVPADKPTVQAAVDAAKPGDLILIAPGVYKEGVNVTTENLTIRGEDRNTTILDGEFTQENGIRVLNANGVSIENLYARNYTGNGFFWTGVTGYRGSYLTTARTCDYGVYAFDSYKGQFDHLYTSGSPDAGIYIGQCYRCDAVITDSVAEYNGLGYSGTNSGGDLYIVNSTFRFNRAGIVPNSGTYEQCYPERETTVAGNLVYSNNQPDTPAIDVALLAMGNGILVAGGRDNVITHNRVYDHERTGIGMVPFPESDAVDTIPPESEMTKPCSESKSKLNVNPDAPKTSLIWPAKNNKITANIVERSGVADIAVGTIGDPPVSQLGNCFSDNTVSSSAPTDLQGMMPCTGTGNGANPENGALDLGALMGTPRPAKGDYKIQPLPPPQTNMPNATTAPARPATDVPMKIDLSTIKTPAAPPS